MQDELIRRYYNFNEKQIRLYLEGTLYPNIAEFMKFKNAIEKENETLAKFILNKNMIIPRHKIIEITPSTETKNITTFLKEKRKKIFVDNKPSVIKSEYGEKGKSILTTPTIDPNTMLISQGVLASTEATINKLILGSFIVGVIKKENTENPFYDKSVLMIKKIEQTLKKSRIKYTRSNETFERNKVYLIHHRGEKI